MKFLLIFFQFCGSGETRRFPPELCFSSGFVLLVTCLLHLLCNVPLAPAPLYSVPPGLCMGIVSSEQVPAPHSKPWRHSLSPFLQKLLKSDQTGLGDTLALSLSYSNFSNQIRRLCVSVFVCLCVDNQHSLSVSFLQKPDETSVGDSLRTR